MRLTQRQQEILDLRRKGMTNKEIALHVGISLSTVYGAVRIVERKTGSKILELLTLAK